MRRWPSFGQQPAHARVHRVLGHAASESLPCNASSPVSLPCFFSLHTYVSPHMYRAMPDSSSYLPQLQRIHFSVLAFTDLYKCFRWLVVFCGTLSHSSRTLMLKRAVDDFIRNQLVISSIALTVAIILHYILWFISLRFILHGFFYTFAYIIAPLAFITSLYSASPRIREALLIFENTVSLRPQNTVHLFFTLIPPSPPFPSCILSYFHLLTHSTSHSTKAISKNCLLTAPISLNRHRRRCDSLRRMNSGPGVRFASNLSVNVRMIWVECFVIGTRQRRRRWLKCVFYT